MDDHETLHIVSAGAVLFFEQEMLFFSALCSMQEFLQIDVEMRRVVFMTTLYFLDHYTLGFLQMFLHAHVCSTQEKIYMA